MKKTILLSLALISQMNFAQVTFNGTRFEKNGTTYKISKYNEVFQNQESLNFVKKGRTNKTVGDVLAFTGGFGMGFSLGMILFNSKETTWQPTYLSQPVNYKTDNSARWTIFGVSTGIALLSIPFYSGANKNYKKAVAAENGETSTTFKPYFNVESAGSGIAMSYNF